MRSRDKIAFAGVQFFAQELTPLGAPQSGLSIGCFKKPT
jgi:hypothetical protein